MEQLRAVRSDAEMTSIDIRYGKRAWTFVSDPAAALLDQLLANGVPANYSCRRGDCGQCAVHVVQGGVRAVDEARPLWQAGSLLTCNAAACSPLSVEIPYDPELEGIKVLRSPAKVHALEKLSKDVVELTLRLPPSNEIRYLPGQYVRVTNRESTVRSYSLSAGPNPDRMLRMHIRRVDDGRFSQWLFERASLNELVHVEGPQGRFFLRDARQVQRSVFLATGTGMAPIWAILSSASAAQWANLGAVSAYWGNRFSADAYMVDQLRDLAERRGFRFTAIFSKEASYSVPAHVQDHMIAEHPSLQNVQLFACGNAAMIESAREKALAAGLAPDCFHSDPFTAS